MTEEDIVTKIALKASRSLHDADVHKIARERHMHDATQSGYEYHLVRVAGEIAARAAIRLTAETCIAEIEKIPRIMPMPDIVYPARNERDEFGDLLEIPERVEKIGRCVDARDFAQAIRTTFLGGAEHE